MSSTASCSSRITLMPDGYGTRLRPVSGVSPWRVTSSTTGQTLTASLSRASCTEAGIRRPPSPNRGRPARSRLAGNEGVEFFGLHDRARVLQRGLEIFVGQSGIVLENLFFGPALSQKVDNQLHRQAGAADDRLAHENLRVYDDAFLPGHWMLLELKFHNTPWWRPPSA